MSEEKRNLTDDDIQALADELECRLVKRFYTNVGKGVWGIVWKAIIGVVVAIAAYGTIKSGHLP